MSSRFSDALFQLIRSLQKSEKRNFKLYIRRNSAREDLKVVQLFDALDRMQEYDEKLLLKRLPSIQKSQLANLKTFLYKQILASLRLIRTNDSIDLQLHEQLDHARILYNRGLYLQSLKLLEKVKELSHVYHQDSILVQAISLEKKIESLHITRSMPDRAEQLSAEAMDVQAKRALITKLSNMALQLYSWYVRNGHARNEKEEAGVKAFFQKNFPAEAFSQEGFYERLYIYQSFCWYAFIRQDFLMYYRYTRKWVELFHSNELMIAVEPGHYIKGMHNYLNSHFYLRNYRQFENTLHRFERFAASHIVNQHENFRVQTFIYLSSARINRHFMHGSFKEGLPLIAQIEKKIDEYMLYLDPHRIMVLNYKIATLYFGSGDYETCIDYLQKIINDRSSDLRSDLQCYSRLLHLLAHYELGNESIMDHLIRSVYRFMAKMENLTVVEEEMFRFLRGAFNRPANQLIPSLEKLLNTIRKYEKNRFQTRSFAYLDIISWLESKVYGRPMSEIIRKKYLASKRRLE